MSITGDWGSDCQKHHVYLQWPYIDQASDAEIRCLLAHEDGHSLGLDHAQRSGTGGVMTSGSCPSTYFTTHDKGHLTNDLD